MDGTMALAGILLLVQVLGHQNDFTECPAWPRTKLLFNKYFVYVFELLTRGIDPPRPHPRIIDRAVQNPI